MDVRDLMIGNYVQVNGEVCKIISVSFFDIGISDSKEDFYQEHIDNIEPIPLTPEILVKNGFELQRDKSELGTYYCKNRWWNYPSQSYFKNNDVCKDFEFKNNKD